MIKINKILTKNKEVNKILEKNAIIIYYYIARSDIVKSNFIKYIFIVFVIAIIIAVVYKVNKKEEIKEENKTNVISTEEEVIKEMNLGIASFDTINPILSNNKHVQEISRIIYEPLFEVDNEYKLQKCLAKDWAKTSATTYLIKIQKDIKWNFMIYCICNVSLSILLAFTMYCTLFP